MFMIYTLLHLLGGEKEFSLFDLWVTINLPGYPNIPIFQSCMRKNTHEDLEKQQIQTQTKKASWIAPSD